LPGDVLAAATTTGFGLKSSFMTVKSVKLAKLSG